MKLPSAKRRYLQKVTPRHIDVTARVQRRVERLGGGVLELVALREDLNRFCGGNPLPGEKKELRVRYLVVVRCVGFKSETRCVKNTKNDNVLLCGVLQPCPPFFRVS